MPRLQTPALFKASLNLCAIFIGLTFLPLIMFALLSLYFAFFLLLLPILCVFNSALIISKIVFRYKIALLTLSSTSLCLHKLHCTSVLINGSNFEEEFDCCIMDKEILECTSMMVDGSKIEEAFDGSLKDEEVSLELEPIDFASLFESSSSSSSKGKKEDDEEEFLRDQLCRYGTPWQIQVLQSINREDHKSFYELLTFWRRKERGEA